MARLARPRAADPDMVFVSPCGFHIPRTPAEMPLLEKLPGWNEPRAVREGRLIVADGKPALQSPWPATCGEPRDAGGGALPWHAPAAAPRQRLGGLAARSNRRHVWIYLFSLRAGAVVTKRSGSRS